MTSLRSIRRLKRAANSVAVCSEIVTLQGCDGNNKVVMQNPSAPVVETRQGALSGLTDENVHVWCGIPYAAPPVGEWRWRSPRPPERWDGLREATAFSPSSWQSSEYCQELGGGDPGQFSEDCLYLNVWSPAERAEPLPVMVWLHGGGFTIGAGGLPPYNGKALDHAWRGCGHDQLPSRPSWLFRPSRAGRRGRARSA